MMQSSFPLLSLAIWCPILFGIFVLAFGSNENPGTARAVSLIGSLVSFASRCR
jgi:NADH-quinone oxidoreductase subunit M